MNGINLDNKSNNESNSFIKNDIKKKKSHNSNIMKTFKEESVIEEKKKEKDDENDDQSNKSSLVRINLSHNSNLNEEIKEEKKDVIQSFRDLLINSPCKNSCLLSNIEKMNNESLSNFINNNNDIKYNNISPNSKINNSKHFYLNELNNLSNTPKKIYNNNFSCFKGAKKHLFTELGFNIDDRNKDIEKENDEISSKETVKISINRKPCSLIDSESLNEEKPFLESKYEIKDEINSEENFSLNCNFQEDLFQKENILQSYFNNLITIETLSKKILEKTWIKNLDKEKANYLEKLFNKSSNNLLTHENPKKERDNHKNSQSSLSSSSSIYFTNLETIHIESFEIMPSYENINKITNFKYTKYIQLRRKTREFLQKECTLLLNEINESRISLTKNLNRSTVCENKFDLKKYKSKKFDLQSINRSAIVSGRKMQGNQKIKQKGTMPNLKIVRRGTMHKMNRNSTRNFEKRRSLKHGRLLNSSIRSSSNNLFGLPKKYKKTNSMISNSEELNQTEKFIEDEKDKYTNFYERFSTIKNNHNNDLLDNQRRFRRRKKEYDTELEKMRNIIIQDSQNLNEPSLYYQQLFLNQIQKGANKDIVLPTKKNKNINSSNLDYEIRRTSTDLKNIKSNNKLFSLKKNNYQRTSIIGTSKFKKLK